MINNATKITTRTVVLIPPGTTIPFVGAIDGLVVDGAKDGEDVGSLLGNSLGDGEGTNEGSCMVGINDGLELGTIELVGELLGALLTCIRVNVNDSDTFNPPD
jgi:hypothetical protein